MSNAVKIREIATKTEDLTTEERGALATEHAQQYLEGKADLDPRLKAVVSVGSDPKARQVLPQRGLVMSIVEGDRTTHFLARDVNEFNLDPIRFTLATRNDRSRDLEDAFDKGLPFTLPAGELLEISSASPLLQSVFGSQDPAHLQLDVRPSLPVELATKTLALRLIAGTGPAAKEIPYKPFKIAQMGRREITLTSGGTLPLEVTLKLRPTESGITINIRPKLQGAEVQSLQRVIEFLDALESSGELEVASLDPPGPLARVIGEFSSSLSISSDLKKIVADAAFVSRFFRTEMRVPEKYFRLDVDNLEILKAIATGEPFFDKYINGSFIKDSAQDRALEFSEDSIRVEYPAGWKILKVFDQNIDPGPITIEARNITLIRPEEFRQAYLSASDGNTVRFSAHCKGPCRYILGTPGSPKVQAESPADPDDLPKKE
ncbi:MAG TPA: hypothetical protein VFF64_06515 [Candidatus Eremiobacteraceae bacterium]|nr:hypothetical protein [Candidatus Eremiobacteraceae bacterium]